MAVIVSRRILGALILFGMVSFSACGDDDDTKQNNGGSTIIPGVQTRTDEDADGYPASIDCNDSDPNINPGRIDDVFSNGVDLDCAPDKFECRFKVEGTLIVLPYEYRVRITMLDYLTYSVVAELPQGYGNGECVGEFSDLQGDQVCETWSKSGWSVTQISDQPRRYKLKAKTKSGVADSCIVGD